MNQPTTRAWSNDHDRLDEIWRRTHLAIVAKIDADPALLGLPQRNIQRWTELWGYLHPAYAEWLGILELPWPQVRHLLVSVRGSPVSTSLKSSAAWWRNAASAALAVPSMRSMKPRRLTSAR